MVHWTLFKKNLRDSLVLWSACAACLFLFGWIFVIVNAGWDMASFQAIIELIPEPFQKLAPIPLDQLTSFDARLSVFFEDPLTYVLLAAWCISRCSDTVSGQLSGGTMEMLLAQPISRTQALLTPSLVNLLGMAMLVAAAWFGLRVGIQTASVQDPLRFEGVLTPGGITLLPTTAQRTPLSELVNPAMLHPAVTNLVCLGYFFCGLTTCLSAFDRHRWRTIGIAIGILIVSLVFEILSQSLDGLRWLQGLTFLRAYEPVKFVTRSVAAGTAQWTWTLRDEAGQVNDLGLLSGNAILIALGTVCFGVALWYFRRRDLPAPL